MLISSAEPGACPASAAPSLRLSQAKRRVFLVQRGKASGTGKAGSKRALAAPEEDAGSAAKARELLCMRRVHVAFWTSVRCHLLAWKWVVLICCCFPAEPEVVPVLEELPKWGLLIEVMQVC